GSVGYCSWSRGVAETMRRGGFGFGGKGGKDRRLKMDIRDILYLEKLLNEDPSANDNLKQVDVTMTKTSIEEPPELELKYLPSHLEYAYLEGIDEYPS
nr:DNA-directed DNA polymerase [Tanacetum cinerariifolium]